MTALPEGFSLVLGRSVRRHRGGRVLSGGAPYRVMQLSQAGLDRVRALEAGQAVSRGARELAGRLVDAGIAAPVPGDRVPTAAVTVVVPVRDRQAALERCLASLAGASVVVVDDGSADPQAVAAICARHGARCLQRPASGGPAAARNAGLEHVHTELVAFVDSDCEAPPGWLSRISRHFADPAVGAAAPRVRPHQQARGPRSVLARYAAARSPLDLGDEPAGVAPGRLVSYVPTAALVVRRAALGSLAPEGPHGSLRCQPFDAALRFGEDVDLIWRLHDAGWRVRYDPGVVVFHEEPASWRALLARRHSYGTSAAPLSRRHPGRLAPVILRPQPTVAALLLLAGRPRTALAVAVLGPARGARALSRAGLPPVAIPALGVTGTAQTLLGLSRALTTLALPVLLAGLATRRARPAAAVLLGAAPLQQWARRRPPLDPVRWTLGCLIDDAAYGAGVWRGCITQHTADPLRVG